MNELDRLKSKIRQCDATILEALHIRKSMAFRFFRESRRWEFRNG